MAQKFLTAIDLTKNELQNARIQNLASAPSSPVDGQIYYNTTAHTLNIYDANGTVWVTWINFAEKAAASGVASLNGSSLVVQNPANAQTTPAASKIPLADGAGRIDIGWLTLGLQSISTAAAAAVNNKAFYFTAANVAALYDLTAFGRSLSGAADANAARVLLELNAGLTGDIWVEKAGDTMTGVLNMGSHLISAVTDPVSAQDAATKAYVDAIASGIDNKGSVRAATTANITLSAPQTVDGVSVIAGDRVLVKNQTLSQNNGVYLVAAGAWTRSPDMDAWAEVPGTFMFVEEGTTQADTGWVSTADQGGTLNTTPITWSQFSGAGTVTASNQGTGVGVYDTKVANDLQFRNVKSADTKLGVALVTKDIVLTINEANLSHANIGGVTAIANGGTGQITAPLARAALGATTKYAASVGNGALTTFAVNHALNTTDVIVMVKEVAGGLAQVFPDVVITDANNVQVTFTVAPTSNQYRVIVIG